MILLSGVVVVVAPVVGDGIGHFRSNALRLGSMPMNRYRHWNIPRRRWMSLQWPMSRPPRIFHKRIYTTTVWITIVVTHDLIRRILMHPNNGHEVIPSFSTRRVSKMVVSTNYYRDWSNNNRGAISHPRHHPPCIVLVRTLLSHRPKPFQRNNHHNVHHTPYNKIPSHQPFR